jgi:cyclophilin family peptidyl-prolyl cis-trans isomerase
MRSRALPIALAIVITILIIVGIVYNQKNKVADVEIPQPTGQNSTTPAGSPLPSGFPAVGASPNPSSNPSGSASGAPQAALDLTMDANGLSKSSAVFQTTKGPFKFKFYPKDAPNTVARIAQLIQQGFYNGIVFHRVEPGFVVQTGDPTGTGAGGSGVKLKAEFNDRLHGEGSVAMARTSDPDSADSQFYITFGPQPRLDHQYTVFGQVIEGMDNVRQLTKGDKITSAAIQ